MEYDRLEKEVLIPFKNNQKVIYGDFDWDLNIISNLLVSLTLLKCSYLGFLVLV